MSFKFKDEMRRRKRHIIGQQGDFLPPPPQHPTCGSARGASSKRFRQTGSKEPLSRAGYAIKRRQFSSPIRVHRCAQLCDSSLFFQVRPFTDVPPITIGLWLIWPRHDFCPITPSVSTRRAVSIAVGFCGLSIPFEMALSQTPIV